MMRISKCESGSSAIEFALAAPVLVILALGLLDGWSLASFVTNMRAGIGSAANLYFQGAGDDGLVQNAALKNWQDQPSDAAIIIARTYRCGTQIVTADDVCGGSEPPSIEVLISASGTWIAPFDVEFLGTRQKITHEQTVRIR